MPDPTRDRLECEALFRRLVKNKTLPSHESTKLGESLVHFYKTTVRRTQKFAGIGQIWQNSLPPLLLEHTCLESFRAGVLVVLVDSSSHLYQLKQLLLSGLEKQLMNDCRTMGLKKIVLRPGQWYVGNLSEDHRLTFNE